jgi:hypothetical protein
MQIATIKAVELALKQAKQMINDSNYELHCLRCGVNYTKSKAVTHKLFELHQDNSLTRQRAIAADILAMKGL